MSGNPLRAEILKDTAAVRLADPDALRQYDLRTLQYFLVLAETRNFTLASEQCLVTQPAITAQIRRLEQQLGYPLFFRSAQGVELTGPGEAFRVAARDVWDAYEGMLASMELWKRSRNGVVRLGLDHSAASRAISLALRTEGEDILKGQGQVEECDLADWGRDWSESLLRRQIDVVAATVFGNPPVDEDLVVADVQAESGISVIWNPSALSIAASKMSLPSLLDHPLVLPEPYMAFDFDQRLRQWCRDAYGRQLVDVTYVPSLEAMGMACDAGLGVGLFPGVTDSLVLRRMSLEVSHAFEDLFPRAKRVVVAWRKEEGSAQRTAVLQWLHDCLGAEADSAARLPVLRSETDRNYEQDRSSPRYLLA